MDPFFQKARPPYIEFEQRPVEKRNLAPPLGDGMSNYVPVDYIIVTPPGSKDQLEQEVIPYFINLRKLVKDQMFPPSWLEEYERAYDSWKKDNSFTMDGTPIRVWPGATAAEVKVLLQANIRTVEDLAQANEQAIGRLGMGGRALKQRAVDWFAAKLNGGDLVQQLGAMRHALDEQQKRMESLVETNKKQAAQIESMLQQRAVGQPQGGWPQPVPTAQPSVDPMRAAQKADDDVLDEAIP